MPAVRGNGAAPVSGRTVDQALATADLLDDDDSVYAVLAAEVRRLRAEGETRTEWGVQYRDAEVTSYGEAEAAARHFAAIPPVEGYQLVRREVRTTAWALAPTNGES